MRGEKSVSLGAVQSKMKKKKNKTFKSFYLSLVESVSLVPPCYPEVLKTMQTEKWHIAINIH